MNYFGKPIRKTILDADEVELLTLKFICARLLEYDVALAYKQRLFLHRTGPDLILNRAGDSDATLVMRRHVTGKGVDAFFSTFLYEELATLDDVTFHYPDISEGGVSWGFLKKHLNLALISYLNDPSQREETVKRFILPYLENAQIHPAAD